ncbi:MAG: superoxide dismutase [Candidatus Nealsonbacteria bacterium]|nr:superoxide dismutase [Candidatus Nealsonbacteria bacterium]
MLTKLYSLPELPYGYKDLEPYISEEQLTIHHQKHHAAYVKGANAIFEKLEKARKDGADLDMKATLKELSFHVGGHILHSLFWQNLAPADLPAQAGGGGKMPNGKLADIITEEFGGLERFKQEFTQAAASIEGSGWAALTLDKQTNRPVIMQVEKHNLNMYPNFKLLMVFDFWEHAYYIDYKNEKAKFIEAFWNIVNWEEVAKRLG